MFRRKREDPTAEMHDAATRYVTIRLNKLADDMQDLSDDLADKADELRERALRVSADAGGPVV